MPDTAARQRLKVGARCCRDAEAIGLPLSHLCVDAEKRSAPVVAVAKKKKRKKKRRTADPADMPAYVQELVDLHTDCRNLVTTQFKGDIVLENALKVRSFAGCSHVTMHDKSMWCFRLYSSTSLPKNHRKPLPTQRCCVPTVIRSSRGVEAR